MHAEADFVLSSSGVKVWREWRRNILIDDQSPVLLRKAALGREQYDVQGERLCRFGSENSEDALTWNVFRTLQKKHLLSTALGPEVPPWEGPARVLFWTCDPDRDGVDPDLKAVLDMMEPWGATGQKQQTESDVIILAPEAVVVIESKLGQPKRPIKAWKRGKAGLPPDYGTYVKSGNLKLFDQGFVTEEQGNRYYQLMRNWILANAMGRRLGKPAYLLALVNGLSRNFDGRTLSEEFGDFQRLLPAEARGRARILNWQTVIGRISACKRPELAPLLTWLKGVRALRISS